MRIPKVGYVDYGQPEAHWVLSEEEKTQVRKEIQKRHNILNLIVGGFAIVLVMAMFVARWDVLFG